MGLSTSTDSALFGSSLLCCCEVRHVLAAPSQFLEYFLRPLTDPNARRDVPFSQRVQPATPQLSFSSRTHKGGRDSSGTKTGVARYALDKKSPTEFRNARNSERESHWEHPGRRSSTCAERQEIASVRDFAGSALSGYRTVSAPGNYPALAKVISFPDATTLPPFRSLQTVSREVGDRAFAHADAYDEDGAFPAPDIADLHEAGLFTANVPLEFGGAALSGPALAEVLQNIGWGSLPLGRLFEGHINAIGLVLRYGYREQVIRVASEAREGKLFGVWNTDDENNLRLVRSGGLARLEGRKILASGAGHIERPIVTATDERGQRLMVIPHLRPRERADLSRWTAHGMRASATGAVDFSGVAIEPDEIVGNDGDYERQPVFSGGAWRFAAVHCGGMERLLDLLRKHLHQTGRGQDPHQASRLGQAAIATETARLWTERASRFAEAAGQTKSPDQIVAYVNLARLAVERAGLDLMELVQRSVGLQGFMRPHPIERVSRDLATYLRQPGPDRALTGAAAWVLECEDSAPELWR
jgi:alkylation response protein AidB-like acyl-CoA dehydrogenase